MNWTLIVRRTFEIVLVLGLVVTVAGLAGLVPT